MKKINKHKQINKSKQTKTSTKKVTVGENIIKYLTKPREDKEVAVPIDDEKQNQDLAGVIVDEKQNDGDFATENTTDDESSTVSILKKRIKILESNLMEAKSIIRKLRDVNLEKDLKINQLMQAKSSTRNNSALISEQFSQYFEKSELQQINSVKFGPRNDSRFILTIMRCLYKENERDKLQNRSAHGQKYKGESKLEISIEKKNIMKSMLVERVSYELGPKSEITSDFSDRIKRFNALVKSAIHNIMKNDTKHPPNKRKPNDLDLEPPVAKVRKIQGNFQ